MNPLRPTTAKELMRLKAATRRAVQLAGDVSALAEVTRVKKPALSKYGAPHELDVFMPVDVAVDCDREAGQPVILREMAALEGFDLQRRRAGTAAGSDRNPAAFSGTIGRLTRETADVVAEALTAIADGSITPNERSAMLKEIDEAMAALNAVRAFFERAD